MTSKEVQEMIIDFEKQIEQFGEMITLTNQLSVLKSYKQDLERLECLEKEYKDYQNLSIQVRNAFQISNRNLTQQNEKLKKAIKDEIELLRERRFTAYACDDYKIHSVLNTIIEELEEALGDDISRSVL